MNNKTKSLKNLEFALAGESVAYQKYMFFAKIARRNGDLEVAKLFEDTASAEIAHAEAHLRNLFNVKELTTKKMLELAIAGEKVEYEEMYPGFAKTAREEGAEQWIIDEFEEGIEECREHAADFQKKLEKMEKVFAGLAKVEKKHHDHYQKALDNLNGEK